MIEGTIRYLGRPRIPTLHCKVLSMAYNAKDEHPGRMALEVSGAMHHDIDPPARVELDLEGDGFAYQGEMQVDMACKWPSEEGREKFVTGYTWPVRRIEQKAKEAEAI